MNFPYKERTIFLTLTGSHAYGLSTPESDIDLRGVLIPPKNISLG
jgi:predicted nucleotidyltransferase